MKEYQVLKPFQHIHGYKKPGDTALLSEDEAKRRLEAEEVAEIIKEKQIFNDENNVTGLEPPPDYLNDERPKRRGKKFEGEPVEEPS